MSAEAKLVTLKIGLGDLLENLLLVRYDLEEAVNELPLVDIDGMDQLTMARAELKRAVAMAIQLLKELDDGDDNRTTDD